MSVEVSLLEERKHEKVLFVHERKSGLRSIIAVHDTSLGPSLGGCRLRDYGSLDEAFFDVLRLSEGMTYKNALCGIPFGGGKSVILGVPKTEEERRNIFLAFGEAVESVGGAYFTAEDMGTSVSDMSLVLEKTKYVAGRDPEIGGGGDPSPHTALGVFEGIKACLERKLGSPALTGKHVAIQGIGHVGYTLMELLLDAGAKVTVGDVSTAATEKAAKQYGVGVVATDEVRKVACDVFSPCAIGGIINDRSVGELRCDVIAGAANNQILGDGVEQTLKDKGILYAPDFAINSGGVILCADDLEPGGFDAARVKNRVVKIGDTVGQILDKALSEDKRPGDVALELARDIIAKARR